MGEIGENANDFALAVGAVGTAVDVGNWFNSTFLPGFNKWIGNTPPQLDEDMLLNLNDLSGDSEIIMPGASGDTLAEKPLSGGAFQYTENNAQGTQTSSVQLAYNGSVDELMVTGAGVVADVSAFQINVSTGATDTISGNNDTINAGASSTTALYGTGGIVNFIPNSGAIFRLYNANSSATVNGTGNTVGIWATGDSVTASGETFNFAPGGFSINIAGGSDTVNENSGMSVSASGGGNTINAAAGTMTSVSGTNGNADQINANGLQFGGTSANGLGTGIWLGANTQVNLAGSGDGLNENAGDSVTAYGGGNTIDAAAGTMTSVSGTNGNADQINANGLQFGGTSANGLGTGIWLGANSQASILGSYNGVNVTAGDSVGVIGGGNTIDATAGSTVFVSGTNGTADMVFANGLTSGGVSANGQGTGIWMDANTQAIVQNGNDSIHLGTGDYLQLQGGSGYTVNGGANETIAIVGPQSDTISLVSGAERFYTSAGLEYQERDF